jgi:hypothetical protein
MRHPHLGVKPCYQVPKVGRYGKLLPRIGELISQGPIGYEAQARTPGIRPVGSQVPPEAETSSVIQLCSFISYRANRKSIGAYCQRTDRVVLLSFIWPHTIVRVAADRINKQPYPPNPDYVLPTQTSDAEADRTTIEMAHAHMDHGDMGHGDMGHGDMGHGDMDMCNMNVSEHSHSHHHHPLSQCLLNCC